MPPGAYNGAIPLSIPWTIVEVFYGGKITPTSKAVNFIKEQTYLLVTES